jgi:catechol 2,3-dioxygenase-like lactoylglutathione lyase family enzyme
MAVPVLLVADLDRAVEYYRDALGFQLGYREEDEQYAILHRNQAEIHLHEHETAGSS